MTRPPTKTIELVEDIDCVFSNKSISGKASKVSAWYLRSKLGLFPLEQANPLARPLIWSRKIFQQAPCKKWRNEIIAKRMKTPHTNTHKNDQVMSIPPILPPRKKLKRDASTCQRTQIALLESKFSKNAHYPFVPHSTHASDASVSTLTGGRNPTNHPSPGVFTSSTAGAGSGEFHVYKNSRRREQERLQMLDAESAREREGVLHQSKMEAFKEENSQRTKKNRKRRERVKAARERFVQATQQPLRVGSETSQT